MSYIFRVTQKPGTDQAILGYDWIEVLAIEPWAIAHRTSDYGEWCAYPIKVMYVCLTPRGLTRVTSEDFWIAVDELREYDNESATAAETAAVVTAGEHSVVQVGSTSYGSISTTRDRYDASNVGAQGPNSSGQALNWAFDDVGLPSLAAELRLLRETLRKGAQSPVDDVIIGALAEAEIAAEQKDAPGVARNLKRAGRSALGLARDIGVGVAATAISRSLAM